MPRDRTCLECGAWTDGPNRCPECRSEREKQRGTRQARGYDSDHDKLRKRWEPKVQAGAVLCWRCTQPITPGTAWDLGHDDDNRTRYRGPEHPGCNRATRARRAPSEGGG